MVTPKMRNFWANGIINATSLVKFGYLLTRSCEDRLRLIRVVEQLVPDEPSYHGARTDDELGQAVLGACVNCSVNLSVIGVHVVLYPERVDQ